MKEIQITVTETLSKTFKIYLDENQDVKTAFTEQHWEPVRLLDILKDFLTSELRNKTNGKYRIPQILELLDSCKDWKLSNMTVTYGQTCKDTESVDNGKT